MASLTNSPSMGSLHPNTNKRSRADTESARNIARDRSCDKHREFEERNFDIEHSAPPIEDQEKEGRDRITELEKGRFRTREEKIKNGSRVNKKQRIRLPAVECLGGCGSVKPSLTCLVCRTDNFLYRINV